MRRLEPVLRRALTRPRGLPRGGRLLVGVSGGADSTALLLGLQRLASEHGLALHAAHLHHGLRGREADGDLAFVRALCARLGVPLTAARWDCRRRMRRRGLSGQAGLRTLRREFLTATARRVGAVAIATAHTADDQLETLLLRLGRGTGLAGLGGMSARSGRWLKPLLMATRAEIEADLGAIGEPWREDRSNRDPRYARSRVRHEVIPALLRAREPRAGAAGPPGGDPARARAGLARRASAAALELRQARRLVGRLGARALTRVAQERAGQIALDSRALASYPSLIQRALLRTLWHRLGHAGNDLTHRHLNALQSLVATTRGGSRVDLPNGWWAERDRGILLIRERAAEARRTARVALPGRGRWRRGGIRGAWLTGEQARERLRSRAGGEYFAREGISDGLQLRPGRPDELFEPCGGRRPRRLGEFLVNQRVARSVRARPLVLADAHGILWVVGVRRSGRAPVTDSTRSALWVHTETP